MALTPSNMIPLGTVAPDFTLPDIVSQQTQSLQQLKSSVATVIVFMCNHCPFVVHIQDKLVEVAKKYQAQGVVFVGISSNDVETHPDDAPDKMQQRAKEIGLPFPYLYDETQAVAKAYQAACTPDFFVFDKDLRCVYRGSFDGATPGNKVPVTGEHLAQALDQVIAGQAVSADQKPSVGCNIKWR